MVRTCSALQAKLITFKSRDQHIYINEITRFNDNDKMVKMRRNDIVCISLISKFIPPWPENDV